jgi:hypothetical protein
MSTYLKTRRRLKTILPENIAFLPSRVCKAKQEDFLVLVDYLQECSTLDISFVNEMGYKVYEIDSKYIITGPGKDKTSSGMPSGIVSICLIQHLPEAKIYWGSPHGFFPCFNVYQIFSYYTYFFGLESRFNICWYKRSWPKKLRKLESIVKKLQRYEVIDHYYIM